MGSSNMKEDIWLKFRLRRRKIYNVVPYKGSCLFLSKSAQICGSGELRLHDNAMGRNGRSTLLRMDDASCLELRGNFSVYYGGDIICFPGSRLILGEGFVNSDVRIRCMSEIAIGDGTVISHDVTIMDSDAHELCGSNRTGKVTIGRHVWIGSRALILKGVTIGDGAVIGAGAVVTRDVPSCALAVGVPARVIREGVDWRI